MLALPATAATKNSKGGHKRNQNAYKVCDVVPPGHLPKKCHDDPPPPPAVDPDGGASGNIETLYLRTTSASTGQSSDGTLVPSSVTVRSFFEVPYAPERVTVTICIDGFGCVDRNTLYGQYVATDAFTPRLPNGAAFSGSVTLHWFGTKDRVLDTRTFSRIVADDCSDAQLVGRTEGPYDCYGKGNGWLPGDPYARFHSLYPGGIYSCQSGSAGSIYITPNCKLAIWSDGDVGDARGPRFTVVFGTDYGAGPGYEVKLYSDSGVDGGSLTSCAACDNSLDQSLPAGGGYMGLHFYAGSSGTVTIEYGGTVLATESFSLPA